MAGAAEGVVKVSLRDGPRDWTIVTTLGGPTNQQDITALTASHIAVAAINTFPAILTNLPSGSKVSWEMKVTGNSSEGRGKSSKGRKQKSKKSRNTGKRKKTTSSGAGKKAGSSTS